MIGRSVRNIRRYQQIANILAKHGLGFWLREMGLHEVIALPRRILKQEKLPFHKMGARIRQVLEELGPTYVKLGQIASTRADLIPEEIRQELERLQDQVAPFPVQEVFQILEEEWETSPQEIFANFKEEPMAAASIGQVHQATLHSGEVVAVKVQRPGVQQTVEADLALLYDLISFVEKRTQWVAYYQLDDLLDEIAASLRGELNYLNEARNADKIRHQLEEVEGVYIPGIYWPYTTKKILVMEYVSGMKLSRVEELDAAGIDRSKLAERVSRAILQQILIDGFFHADPHPGNLFVMQDGTLLFLDFGMVGRLPKPLRKQFSGMVVGLMRKSTPAILRSIYQMGIVPDHVDRQQLRADVESLRDQYYDIPLSEVSLGAAVNDLLEVSFRHRIRIPKDLTLVGRALVTMEGLVEQLDPTFRVMDAAEPFGQTLLLQSIQPVEWITDTYDETVDILQYLKHTPRLVHDLLVLLKSDEFRVPLHLDDIPFLRKIVERIANRIAFSLVLLAFSMLMAALVLSSAIGGQDYLIWRFPMAEVGLIVAGIMFAIILWSIFRSGRF